MLTRLFPSVQNMPYQEVTSAAGARLKDKCAAAKVDLEGRRARPAVQVEVEVARAKGRHQIRALGQPDACASVHS